VDENHPSGRIVGASGGRKTGAMQHHGKQGCLESDAGRQGRGFGGVRADPHQGLLTV
jgi:hypothetical protein